MKFTLITMLALLGSSMSAMAAPGSAPAISFCRDLAMSKAHKLGNLNLQTAGDLQEWATGVSHSETNDKQQIVSYNFKSQDSMIEIMIQETASTGSVSDADNTTVTCQVTSLKQTEL